jgi:hypothetical protein
MKSILGKQINIVELVGGAYVARLLMGEQYAAAAAVFVVTVVLSLYARSE